MAINKHNIFVLWDVKTQELASVEPEKPTETTARLKWYHELLNCDIFTFTTRIIGGQRYDLMVDDNGLMYDDHIVSLFGNGKPELVGNILFTISDEQGETLPLKRHQVDNLLQHLDIVMYQDHEGNIQKALHYDY